MRTTEFFGLAVKEMLEYDVSLSIRKRTKLSKYALNTFDPGVQNKNSMLTILNFGYDWNTLFNIFIHEYAHFLQWKDKSDIFEYGLLSLDLLDRYCDNDPLVTTFHEYDLWRIQNLEIDCEKRVLELNKRCRLNIDLDTYIRQSNAYIYSYRYVMESKNWGIFKTDFDHNDVINLMPKKLFTKEQLQIDIPEFREICYKSIRRSSNSSH